MGPWLSHGRAWD